MVQDVEAARRRLLHPLFVFYKRAQPNQSYTPCYPGEEDELTRRYHTEFNSPHPGTATIHLGQGLSKKEKSQQKAKRRRIMQAEGHDELEIEAELVDIEADEEDDEDMVAVNPHPVIIPANAILIPFRYPARPPQYVVGRLPLPAEVSYKGYVQSDQSYLLCVNTRTVFPPPSNRSSVVFRDGYWGEHEPSLYPQMFDRHAPWLGYMVIAHDDFRRPLRQSDRSTLWTVGLRGSKSQEMSPADEILSALSSKRLELRSKVSWCIEHVLKMRCLLNRDVTDNDLPRQTLHNECRLFFTLVSGVVGWKSFVIAMRAYERVLLEMQAFVDWSMDIKHWPVQHAPKSPQNLRGSIFLLADSDIFIAFAYKQSTLR